MTFRDWSTRWFTHRPDKALLYASSTDKMNKTPQPRFATKKELQFINLNHTTVFNTIKEICGDTSAYTTQNGTIQRTSDEDNDKKFTQCLDNHLAEIRKQYPDVVGFSVPSTTYGHHQEYYFFDDPEIASHDSFLVGYTISS